MEKHARFAEDYKLPAYEWVANSNNAGTIMRNALANLKEQAMSIKDETLRAKLLARYGKIHIVNEIVFEEE